MNSLKKLFARKTIPVGRYTYRGKDEFAHYALQLRIEPDETGILVVNANTVLYLNQTAAAHAYFFMQGLDTDKTVNQLLKMYRVRADTAKREHENLVYKINTLAHTDKVCPISFLDVKTIEPFTKEYSAPLRMDLAVTFRCQNDCVHCYAGGPHKTEELTTEQWKTVIDRMHQAGIFIVTFTGGEPTLREDLPELLLHAQNRGIVTGLVTNGRRLRDKEYVKTLEKAGLDFVQVTLESHIAKIHDKITSQEESWKETVEGIKNAVSTSIYVTTNTTLSRDNIGGFLDTIDFIRELGVAGFGCNSLIYAGKGNEVAEDFVVNVEALKQTLPKINEKANRLGLKFLWYTPTQYCRLDPVKLGLGIKSCTAAMINMCIGPEGDVYPCQSYFESLGNILKADWQHIWNNPLAIKIRKREYAEPKCKDCPQLQICGGGCPLELASKARGCFES